MNKHMKILTVLAISGLTTALVVQPTDVHAGFWKRGHRYKKNSYGYKSNHYPYSSYSHKSRHYPNLHGKILISLPRGFVKFTLGGSRYYYHGGHYYHKDHYGYRNVSAPIGACIAHLPYGYETVYVNGYRYSVYNGVYYKHTFNGYEVVNRPQLAVVKNIVTSKVTATAGTDEVITLNIPNNQGGYTPVIIKRSGDGFVGPQDEYYEDFPRVEHLKAVYGS